MENWKKSRFITPDHVIKNLKKDLLDDNKEAYFLETLNNDDNVLKEKTKNAINFIKNNKSFFIIFNFLILILIFWYIWLIWLRYIAFNI